MAIHSTSVTMPKSSGFHVGERPPPQIGLILGDYVIASFWTLWGVAFGLEMYRCFPS
jgi:hypothetical protein